MAEKLGCGWSPPPVSGRLRVLFPGDDAMRVCPETVYRWIHSSKPRRERRARCLPRGHRRRRKHAGRRVSRFPIPGRVSIAERPPEADARSGFGHWEADSVIGMGCDKCDALYANTLAALEKAGITARVEKVEDLVEIVRLGVMAAPSLMVDGKLVLSGRTATVQAIVKLLEKERSK